MISIKRGKWKRRKVDITGKINGSMLRLETQNSRFMKRNNCIEVRLSLNTLIIGQILFKRNREGGRKNVDGCSNT